MYQTHTLLLTLSLLLAGALCGFDMLEMYSAMYLIMGETKLESC